MTANTLANPANKQETITASINERKLLDSVRHMFTTSWTMFGELMQNARRAHGTKVEFTLEGTNCTVKDDGDGVKDFSKFVAICESGWDNQTMIEENPFGMGFLSCLMAAEQVEIHSGNKMVRISLKAVQEKKPIRVETTDKTVIGTEIHLVGLDSKLCETQKMYGSNEHRFILESKLKEFAKGFPIDVFFNSKKLDRPHAKSALAGSETEIGFVSIVGVDRSLATSENTTNMPKGFESAVYYLQGLPIGGGSYSSDHFIVHLDTKRFLPRVPDRTELFDKEEALKLIKLVMDQQLRNLLVSLKSTLDPKVFVLRYWGHCWDLGVPHLLSDVPFVPARIFKKAVKLTQNPEDTFEGSSYLQEEKLMPMEDFQSGVVRAFKTQHTSVDFDDRYGVEVLFFLAHFELLCTSKEFMGHWLADYLVDTDDLTFEITPVNLVESEVRYAEWGNVCASLRLCDSLKLKVTSGKQPEMVYEVELTEHWYARNPADHWTEEARSKVKPWTLAESVDVYVPSKSAGYDIADILSSFLDENDRFDEDAQGECERDIVNMISSMRGLPLSKMLDRNVDIHRLNLNAKSIGNMALVQVVPSQHSRTYPCLDFADMDAAYFETLAEKLQDALRAPGVTLTGDLLKSVMVTPPAKEETTTEG